MTPSNQNQLLRRKPCGYLLRKYPSTKSGRELNPIMIKIKEFSSIHQTGILDLIVNIQQNEFEIAITAKDQPDLCDIENFYQKGNGNFWVALSCEKVIGTISLLDIGNDQVALRKMFVAKAYRGGVYKVAQTLLNELLNWATARRVKGIYLGTTPKFLAAHRFYEKNRFDVISKKSLPESFPIMKVDTKFYRMELKL